MNHIRLGLENGLSKEQVSILTNPEFDWDQKNQIRLGLENGLTEEQILVFAKPEFNWMQMDEIREGLEEGLNVSSYADPGINAFGMATARAVLSEELNACYSGDNEGVGM